jgi:toxin ParE1/3/4
MKLRWSPRSRTDIAEIHAYIAAHNPRAATAVIRHIRDTARLLASHPRMGRPTDIDGVRVLPVGRYPYLVCCTTSGNELIIVHVRHGARAVPTAADLKP